jgi:hypothetical protein
MAAPMMTQKVINNPKAAIGAKTAQSTIAISLHIPTHQILSFEEKDEELTLGSISWGVGHSHLHPGWWLSGESSPSLIHESRPLIIFLTLNSYFQMDSLICVFLELGESSPDNINCFLVHQYNWRKGWMYECLPRYSDLGHLERLSSFRGLAIGG